jgi:PTH1 family peptidyl-tRNA hydrolase
VGRPDSTDPDVVARYVLSRFDEPEDEVRKVVERTADEVERLVREIAEEHADPLGEVID